MYKRQVQNNDNLEGYKSIAIPGAISGLFLSHQMFGTIPMKELMVPAIKLARDGFYPEWYDLYAIGLYSGKFTRYSELAKTFLPDGEMPKSGILFKQPDLADTLEHISRNGADEFYKEDIAEEIARSTQEQGGLITIEDLANWKVYLEEPVKVNYKGIDVFKLTHWVQGPVMLQSLNMLEEFDLKSMGYNSSRYIHTLYQVY